MDEPEVGADAGANTIADRLVAIRKARGLSRAEAARLAGKHDRWLEAYEQGAVAPPEAAIELLGKVYGLHPAVIRYGEGAYLTVPSLMAAAADQIEAAARKLVNLAAEIRQLHPVEQAEATADDDYVTPTEPGDASPAAPRRARGGAG